MCWQDGPLLGFDTETTGVDPHRDRIVSAALVHRDTHGTRARTWLLDPGVPVPEAATAVHGITTDQARAGGRAPREALDEIAGTLAAALAAGVPVVAFNAAFDLTILDAELARHGLATLEQRLGRAVAPVLDPLVLDRALDRPRAGKRRLADLCDTYGLEPRGSLHTAEVDVVATLDLLAALAERHPVITAMPPGQLHAWQATAHRSWALEVAARRLADGLAGPGPDGAWPVAASTRPRDPGLPRAYAAAG